MSRKKRRLIAESLNSVGSQLTREPTGARLRWVERHPSLAGTLAVMLFFVLIECLQYVSRTGTFEIDDIFNNLVGAIVAIGLWNIWNAVRKTLLFKER